MAREMRVGDLVRPTAGMMIGPPTRVWTVTELDGTRARLVAPGSDGVTDYILIDVDDLELVDRT